MYYIGNIGNNYDKYSNKVKNIYIQSRILIKVCGDILEFFESKITKRNGLISINIINLL